ADPSAPEASHADGQPVHRAAEGCQRRTGPGGGALVRHRSALDGRASRGGPREGLRGPHDCRGRRGELGSDPWRVVMGGEFEDEYSATIDDDPSKTDDLRETSGALLNDTIGVLSPAEPICLSDTATVHEAARTMLARRQAGGLVA